MQLPSIMPTRLSRTDQSVTGVLAAGGRIVPQGLLDWLPGVGGGVVKCAACCAGKAGFAACVAGCVATGQACDGGLNNCSPC